MGRCRALEVIKLEEVSATAVHPHLLPVVSRMSECSERPKRPALRGGVEPQHVLSMCQVGGVQMGKLGEGVLNLSVCNFKHREYEH